MRGKRDPALNARQQQQPRRQTQEDATFTGGRSSTPRAVWAWAAACHVAARNPAPKAKHAKTPSLDVGCRRDSGSPASHPMTVSMQYATL